MNKELIELQKGCKATAVVILDEDVKELEEKIVIESRESRNEILNIIKDKILDNKKVEYLVIEKIDEIDENMQNKYYHLVKDREYMGYSLPENVIIVLTVNNKEGLKIISQELYHLCVVAI